MACLYSLSNSETILSLYGQVQRVLYCIKLLECTSIDKIEQTFGASKVSDLVLVSLHVVRGLSL